MVVVVIFGPSGAGKTTLAVDRYDLDAIVSPDQYRYRDGAYCHDGSGLPLKRCRAEVRRRLARGDEWIVVDTAATRAEHLDTWAALAYDYDADVVWIGVTTRDPSDLRRNVHGTPARKLGSMWRDMDRTLAEWDRPTAVQVCMS